jgi:thiamine pyrophosphokinase
MRDRPQPSTDPAEAARAPADRHHETVVVVTGSEPLDPSVRAHVPDDAIVLAADGGLDHALAAGLVPAGLIGDLDSVTPEGLAWAQAHATIQRHPADKDRTDTELAVAFAAAMDPERLVLLAGGGDRLDHAVAAVGALGARELTGVPVVEGWWGRTHLRVLHGPARATVPVEPGTTVSLLAMHGNCTGVSVTGTKWELHRVELAAMSGHGVSNVAVDAQVRVAVSTGVLTVFVIADVIGDAP